MNNFSSKQYIDGELSKPVLKKFSVPQGYVMGPKFYTMHIKPVGSICKPILSFKPTDNVAHIDTLRRVDNCLNDIVAWMHDNMLKLNTNKRSYCLFIATQHQAC